MMMFEIMCMYLKGSDTSHMFLVTSTVTLMTGTCSPAEMMFSSDPRSTRSPHIDSN